MQFKETLVRWKGHTTEVKNHAEGPLAFGDLATWKYLVSQGVKTGALTAVAIGAFIGMIKGFEKEGIPGALKGIAAGGIAGLAVGGALGGLTAIAGRFSPAFGKMISTAGLAVTFLFILLDPSPIGPNPQDFVRSETDPGANVWRFRNFVKTDLLFPENNPKGIRIECADRTVVELGEEAPYQSSYQSTPVTVFAKGCKEVRWINITMVEGSRMWWWQDTQTLEAHLLTFQDQEAEQYAIRNFAVEKNHRL
jgi:hypothetical protein